VQCFWWCQERQTQRGLKGDGMVWHGRESPAQSCGKLLLRKQLPKRREVK